MMLRYHAGRLSEMGMRIAVEVVLLLQAFLGSYISSVSIAMLLAESGQGTRKAGSHSDSG